MRCGYILEVCMHKKECDYCLIEQLTFTFVQTMKFWRLRMLIFPTRIVELKKLMEGLENFDIFPSAYSEDKNPTVECFLKFIETCINRIRRPNNSFPKVS